MPDEQPSWQRPRQRPEITSHPDVQFGQPCIAGTRIPAWFTGQLAVINGRAEVERGWPMLTPAEIDLAIWFYKTRRKRYWRRKELP